MALFANSSNPPLFHNTPIYSPDIQLSETEEQPTDTISKISWGPSSSRNPIFATSNWDSYIRIYQVNVQDKTMAQTASFSSGSPSFCVNWHPEMTRVFAGCAPNLVKEFDVETGKGIEIGRHRAQVKDVYWISSTQTLCSVSSDKTIRFWDVRQTGHVSEIKLEYQPYCSDMFENKLLLGLAKSNIALLDVVEAQKSNEPKAELKSCSSVMQSEKPYSSIKFIQDGSRITLGGLDGRANVSIFEAPDEDFQSVKLTNKVTWRAAKNAQDELIPIKCMFVSKKNSDFVGTGMEDGRVQFWDSKALSKIREFNIGSPLACSAMHPEGSLLALATGENWYRGDLSPEEKQSKIFVHIMAEADLTFQANKTNG